MSYDVELALPFRDSLRTLPPYLAEIVLDAVDRLADGPTSVSESSAPGGQRYQVYSFRSPPVGPVYDFELRFQYSQDEQTLHILDLWVVTMP